MAGSVVQDETELTAAQVARYSAWPGCPKAESLVTPLWGNSRSIDCDLPVAPPGDTAYTPMADGTMSTHKRRVKPTGKAVGRQGNLPAELSRVNLNAAGVEVGAGSHFLAVPEGRCEQPVRETPPRTSEKENGDCSQHQRNTAE